MENGQLNAQPWLASLGPWWNVGRPQHSLARALLAFWPSVGGSPVSGARAPVSGGGLPIQPVPAGEPLGALAYERLIAATGQLPTRDNAHDWYNALVWLAFPETRRTINRLQVEEGDGSGHNGRTRRRDALTLLDENGAVLVTCESSLREALLQHDWNDLFVRQRSRWRDCASVWVMGHAMLEKLEQPRPDLCAHIRVCVMGATEWVRWSRLSADERRCELDTWLARDIGCNLHTPADLQPLPLMGIPGWHVDNMDSDFYNNRQVFRPKRHPKMSPPLGG